MGRLSWLLLVILLLSTAAMVYAQGGMGRPGQMNGADRTNRRQQMMERRLAQAGLTSQEQTAARHAMKVKNDAQSHLTSAFTKLQLVANAPSPTNQQMQEALTTYRAQLAQYRKTVANADAALVKQLSLKGQIKAMALGILDNGFSGRARMGRPGGARGGPGGMRGGTGRPSED